MQIRTEEIELHPTSISASSYHIQTLWSYSSYKGFECTIEPIKRRRKTGLSTFYNLTNKFHCLFLLAGLNSNQKVPQTPATPIGKYTHIWYFYNFIYLNTYFIVHSWFSV